ncbi:MAG: hypothetical protein K6B44_07755 [Lachnospiraceae bacterium]|nr:hypothetical protein [Lachnospiraceae bacterium]
MTYEEARALREVEHALRRAEQDRLFYRNEMIVQKLSGLGLLLACIALTIFMVKILRGPLITVSVLMGPIVALAIYLIFTHKNLKRTEETV